MKAPFRLLNAGALASVVLPPALRLAWEAPPVVQVKVVANGNDATIVFGHTPHDGRLE
jgi:hypothetical protein